jgi:hypothetical protein
MPDEDVVFQSPAMAFLIEYLQQMLVRLLSRFDEEVRQVKAYRSKRGVSTVLTSKCDSRSSEVNNLAQ